MENLSPLIIDSVEILTHMDENDFGNKTSDVTLMFKYWLDGPIGFSISLVGILINLIAILALGRQQVQRTFHLLMIYLSCWDFMYLILSVICFALPVVSVTYRDNVFIYLLPYAIPLAQICLSGSCYSTIALTVERYIAVCAPFFRLRHNIKARFYILPILLFAPLYNVPRFFEFKTATNITYTCIRESGLINDTTIVAQDDSSSNSIVLSPDEFGMLSHEELTGMCNKWNRKFAVELVVTDFRVNPIYVSVYINYVNLVVNLLIPTGVLTVMNCLIYRALRQNQAQANQLRRSTGGGAQKALNNEEALRKRDIRLTRIAIVIVGIFITCHLPRFIPNFGEMFMKNLPEWFAILISFNNLLQIVNSTVNYVIYFSHCYKKSDKSSSSLTRTEKTEIELESRSLIQGPNTFNGSSKVRRQNTMV